MCAAIPQVLLCHHPVLSRAPEAHLKDSTTEGPSAAAVPAVHRVAHTPHAPTATVRLLDATVDALHLLSPHPHHSSSAAAAAAAAVVTTSTLRLVTRHATATATMVALLQGCTVLQAGEAAAAAAAVTGTLHGVAATVHCAAVGQRSAGMMSDRQGSARSAAGEYELTIQGTSVAVVAALRQAVLHRCCAQGSSVAAPGVDTTRGGFEEAAAMSRDSEGRERRESAGDVGGDHGERGRTGRAEMEYRGRRLLVTAREGQLTALEKLQRHVAALGDATDSCERLWALAIGTALEQRAGPS